MPSKLVRKIQAVDYVEMQDLLPDNIALTECLPTHNSSRMAEAQEVGTLSTWDGAGGA